MVSDSVRNRDELHLWLWRPLAMADQTRTLVPLRTSAQWFRLRRSLEDVAVTLWSVWSVVQ